MSNTEADPDEQVICRGADPGTGPEVLEPREVPLGGPRAMLVRRALPGKTRRMIGAWCFADSYGPEEVRMEVPPHPHTSLQTVSWLVSGQIRHRDSLGRDEVVHPGDLVIMTAGRGIAHSEVSPPTWSGVLHGVQLWVALPDAVRHREPDLEVHRGLPRVEHEDATVTVIVGSLLGASSPATTHTPIVGAQIALPGVGRVRVPLEATFEHGVLPLTDGVRVAGVPVPIGSVVHLPPGTPQVLVESGPTGARVLLLGGEPFEEELVMWWNFVGRTHEEVVAARATWEAEREAPRDARERFGTVAGHDGLTLPAPALPHVRLRPRPRTREP